MTIDLYVINKKIIAFFSRFHLVTFVLIASLLFVVAIALLVAVVESATTTPTNASSTISGFDQKTIDKIKSLRDSSGGNAQLQLPSPRSNPFSE